MTAFFIRSSGLQGSYLLIQASSCSSLNDRKPVLHSRARAHTHAHTPTHTHTHTHSESARCCRDKVIGRKNGFAKRRMKEVGKKRVYTVRTELRRWAESEGDMNWIKVKSGKV